MFDRLTGTLSKDFFRFLLELEGSRAVRYCRYVSILDLEIDQIENDQNLAKITRLIRQSLRYTDLMGKMGPQRFSVLLHYAEGRDAYRVAERIRDRVADSIFVSNNGPYERTVSIGGACLPTHASDLKGLLRAANTMLSKAKSVGGNLVCLPEV